MSRADIDRNVRFLDASNNEIAGFCSEYALFRCLEDSDPQDPAAKHGPRIALVDNKHIIDTGYYVILSTDGSPLEAKVSLETAIPRSVSRNLSNSDPQVVAFRDRVRTRDRCCVLTGVRVPGRNFTGFEAVHIFPLAHLDLWRSDQWGEEIEDDGPGVGESKIPSAQNDMLLSQAAHTFFNKSMIAINPDDSYKVTCFTEDPWGFDGRCITLSADSPEQRRPLRSLLKHHFRMAVLCNMKARGPEYDWDEDITPGMDPVFEISHSEKGKLSFELVMAEKLNALVA